MTKTFGDEWLESRMMLDLIPGLQIDIDAKLNRGNLSVDEAESCRAAIRNLKAYIEHRDEDEELRCLVMEGYTDRYGNSDDAYRKKALSLIDHELSIVKTMNLAGLFLAVHEIVLVIKDSEIPMGTGRGAVPESIINYCLGITDVDPIQFSFVFERFLNPDRNQAPFFTLEIPNHNVKLLKGYIEKYYPCYSENIEILPLCAVEIIRNTVEHINANFDKDINLNVLDYSDNEVYKSILTENCIGILYLEHISEFMKEFEPRNLEEIAAAIAMYRDGSNEFIPDYLYAKNHSKSDGSVASLLEGFTRDTYGNVIYQEQVMRILHDLAGFSWIQSDYLRRSLSKQERMNVASGRKSFIYGNVVNGIEGCVARGIPEETASEIYDLLVERTKYTLNKSHFVAYAKMIYQQGWLKYYYPDEFIKISNKIREAI